MRHAMGKRHNKMPKAFVEMYVEREQRTLATNHDSEPIDRHGYFLRRVRNTTYFYNTRPRSPAPLHLRDLSGGDGVHAGLDFILHCNNGTALFDPTR